MKTLIFIFVLLSMSTQILYAADVRCEFLNNQELILNNVEVGHIDQADTMYKVLLSDRVVFLPVNSCTVQFKSE